MSTPSRSRANSAIKQDQAHEHQLRLRHGDEEAWLRLFAGALANLEHRLYVAKLEYLRQRYQPEARWNFVQEFNKLVDYAARLKRMSADWEEPS